MPRPKTGQSPWVPTSIILVELGISKAHLYRLRDELFVLNHHYKNIGLPSSMRPTYRWHKGKIAHALKQATEPEVRGARDSDKSPETPAHEPCP